MDIMGTISLGSVKLETRAKLKEQTVTLHLDGKKHNEIVKALGISYDAVSRIVRTYRKNGKLTEEKTRGRKNGEKRTLSAEQEKNLQSIIIDKCPDQMMLNFPLWNRAAVKQLIQDMCGIDMPLRSVSNYLKRWGMMPKFPFMYGTIKKAYSLTDYSPAIFARAKKEKAAIYLGYETTIVRGELYVRTFPPINMISAITGRGTCRFMCYRGNLTSKRLIDFMNGVVRASQGKKVFFVFEHDVSYEAPVRDWLDKHEDKIELLAYADLFSWPDFGSIY